MSEYGDVVGSPVPIGDEGVRPFLLNLAAPEDIHHLPALPGTDDQDSAFAGSVSRGATELAPNGGVTVGGWSRTAEGDYYHREYHATVWTCAYRQPE